MTFEFARKHQLIWILRNHLNSDMMLVGAISLEDRIRNTKSNEEFMFSMNG